MLGGIQECFERTVEYLKTREQFGVPIGSFQSLKHRAAQMFCEVELSKSVVLEALSALDENSDQIPELASLAKARLNDTYNLVSSEGVQMHGGIGMTDEYEIGFFMKRSVYASILLAVAPFIEIGMGFCRDINKNFIGSVSRMHGFQRFMFLIG